MPISQHLPDPRLKDVVQTFWHGEGVARDDDLEQHQRFPQHMWHLSFCSPNSWQRSPGGLWTQAPAATLEPLSLAPEGVATRGFTRRLAAEVYPWAAHQLFGWALENPEQLGAAPESQGIQALLALGDWKAAYELLTDWLLRLQAAHAAEPGKGVLAAQQLYAEPGQANVGALAEELNVSTRQLEREFKKDIGVTPKTLARLIRFDAVVDQLLREPGTVLTTLAYDLGFTDQAHLTKEFRALSLMSPSTFSRHAQHRQNNDPVQEG